LHGSQHDGIGPGPIFDDDGLLPALRKSVPERSRRHVDRYARAERRDDPHRVFGPTADKGLRLKKNASSRRAAKRDYEFSPSDVDCHATLQWEACHAMGGNDITL
jgi:hypothetical protein